MKSTTWTVRLAAMLSLALHALNCEAVAATYDGGLGVSAMVAIAAHPPGPRRDFEVALWARRVISGPGRIAIAIHPDATDDELAAIIELHRRVMTETEARS